MRWLDPIALLLFPASCECCGAALRPSAAEPRRLPRRACPPCLAHRLARAGSPSWSLEGLPGRSLFWYEEEESRWIRAIKEGGEEGFLDQLARQWPEPPLPVIPTKVGTSSPLLIPVPADPLRARRRGGDHVARLARRWARAWGLDCASLLARRGGGKQQGLGAGQRRRNLEGQYRARSRAQRERGRDALLVDDVVTTGATLTVCRRLLEESGLRVAGALTLACAPRPELRLDWLAIHAPDAGEVHDAARGRGQKARPAAGETFEFP